MLESTQTLESSDSRSGTWITGNKSTLMIDYQLLSGVMVTILGLLADPFLEHGGFHSTKRPTLSTTRITSVSKLVQDSKGLKP